MNIAEAFDSSTIDDVIDSTDDELINELTDQLDQITNNLTFADKLTPDEVSGLIGVLVEAFIAGCVYVKENTEHSEGLQTVQLSPAAVSKLVSIALEGL